MILSSVCTSSVWNPVKRIFQGSACDVCRYPWLSRHNQPSTTRTTTTRAPSLLVSASCPSTSLRPSLSWTLYPVPRSLYRRPLHQHDTLPDHQSVCVTPNVCLSQIVGTTWNAAFRKIATKTQVVGPRMTHPTVCRLICIGKSKSHGKPKLDPTSRWVLSSPPCNGGQRIEEWLWTVTTTGRRCGQHL